MRIMMKLVLLVMSFAWGTLLGSRVQATSELENHDSAFSLLITAFAEVQTSLIENDYQAQQQAAASIQDYQTRQDVVKLARQERELRLRKLNRQLAELSAAYVHSRQSDAQKNGDHPPAKVDIQDAQKKLNRFVIVETATIQTNRDAEEKSGERTNEKPTPPTEEPLRMD